MCKAVYWFQMIHSSRERRIYPTSNHCGTMNILFITDNQGPSDGIKQLYYNTPEVAARERLSRNNRKKSTGSLCLEKSTA